MPRAASSSVTLLARLIDSSSSPAALPTAALWPATRKDLPGRALRAEAMASRRHFSEAASRRCRRRSAGP